MSNEAEGNLPEDASIGADIEMVEDHEAAEGQDDHTASELPFAEEEAVEPRMGFLNYLMSPIVTLLIGQESQTLLSAHQALLTQSPYFQEICTGFVDDGTVSTSFADRRTTAPGATPDFSANVSRQQPRQIELPGEDMDAVGCFLEFLYTGEYFPRKVAGQRVLEADPSLPAVDDTGDQLLKHARVYTLAEKFGVERLKTLASSKIHCINSTAKGEIAYARYVYAYTDADDKAVRAPIASFWATRSHTLRAEAEDEFKSLCLEYPQFGYEVLSRWLSCWWDVTAAVVLSAMLTVLGSAGPGRQAQEGAQREDAPGHGQWAEEGPTQQHFPTGLDRLVRLLGGKRDVQLGMVQWGCSGACYVIL